MYKTSMLSTYVWNYIFMNFFHSMKECQCIPWDMIRNDTRFDYQLCESGGNRCFWQKMGNETFMDRKCFSLSDCSDIKYWQFSTLKPLQEDEYLEDNWSKSDIISNPSLSQEKALVLSRFLKPKKGFSKWKALENLAMGKYFKGLCRKRIGEDRTELIVRLEGPTFMTLKVRKSQKWFLFSSIPQKKKSLISALRV